MTTDSTQKTLNIYKNFKDICKEIGETYMRCDPNIIRILKINDEHFKKLKNPEIITYIKEYLYDYLDKIISYDDLDYLNHILDLIHISFKNNITINSFDIYQAIAPSYQNAGILGLMKAIQPILHLDEVRDKIMAISIIEKYSENPNIKKYFISAIEEILC